MEPRPVGVEFAVGVNSAKAPSRSLFLPPFGLGTMGFEAPFEVTLPDKAEFSWSLLVEEEAERLDVGRVAFELVQRVYAYFKLIVEEIPYLSESRDAVDPAVFGRRPS